MKSWDQLYVHNTKLEMRFPYCDVLAVVERLNQLSKRNHAFLSLLFFQFVDDTDEIMCNLREQDKVKKKSCLVLAVLALEPVSLLSPLQHLFIFCVN